MTVSLSTSVKVSGPLFDPGVAERVFDRAAEAGGAEVAQVAVDLVRARLSTVLRHPTGRYSSRVVADLAVPDRPTVTDGGIVYGPWLEGTASRNDRSRFKGYRTFRIVAQELDGKAAELAEPAVLKVVEELR